MTYKVVLVSNDNNFFEYFKEKLFLRKSDELFTFKFEELNKKVNYLSDAILIFDSENNKQLTLNFLKKSFNIPTIITVFNEDLDFKNECYKLGAFDFISIAMSDEELKYRLKPVFKFSGLIKTNKKYVDLLVENDVMSDTNGVFKQANKVIDKELEKIKLRKQKAVFLAISTEEKNKFLVKQHQLETIILNSIRQDDVLISYAPNKYYLFLYNADLDIALKIIENLNKNLSQRIYAGISVVYNQVRQQLISETLNKLHESINNSNNLSDKIAEGSDSSNNFKMQKQNFFNNLEKIIVPVFYQLQQKYSLRFKNYSINHSYQNGLGLFEIVGKINSANVKISCPGLSKINIDFLYLQNSQMLDKKRISFEPYELDAGLLTDLMEQFILEYKQIINNEGV